MLMERVPNSSQAKAYPRVNDHKHNENLESIQGKLQRLDNEWRSLCCRARAILLNHVLLVLMRKVYCGTLPRDQLLETLQMIKVKNLDEGLIAKKLDKLMELVENNVKNSDSQEELAEVVEILSSAKEYCNS